MLLISSDETLPDNAFHGSCFVGTDYVSGSAGARDYLNHVGAIRPGEDGAYSVLTRVLPNEWVLGTDYKGFSHIFYYADEGRRWVVSNSFVALVRYLRGLGIDPPADPAPLAAFASNKGAFVRSLMSYRTAHPDIRLLASDAVLRLQGGPQPSLLVKRRADTYPLTSSYESALARHLDLWVARFATLLSDPNLRLTVHITGGRDSRSVLALVLAAMTQLGSRQGAQLRFRSQSNKPDDLSVATSLGAAFGFAVNDGWGLDMPQRLSSRQSFRSWEEMSVGCYADMMFPERHRSLEWVTVPGVAGEAHRRTYAREMYDGSIADVAETQRQWFHDDRLFDDWRDSLVAADDWLAGAHDAHPLPMVRSHREFRDRFHSGKQSFYSSSVLALAARSLVACSNILAPHRFSNGQILYDIMANAAPGLMDQPYDLPWKEPGSRGGAELTDLNWSPSMQPGRVYMRSLDGPVDGMSAPPPQPLAHVLSGASGVLYNREALGLLGANVLKDGLEVLQKNVDSNIQNLHGRGRTAHLAYLANLIL